MFHDYYDIIYQDYDYELDALTLEHYRQAFHLNNSSLLEIGCGTGRHTTLLSKYFESIYAIDIDPSMIERAKCRIEEEKIKNVSFSHCSALEIQPTLCDMACAFFNVINYLLEFNDLVLFSTALPAPSYLKGLWFLIL